MYFFQCIISRGSYYQCLIPGGTDFYNLVKVQFSGFLHCKVVIFPLIINKYLDTLKQCKSCFSSNCYSLILTSIKRSCTKQLLLWGLSDNEFLFIYFLEHVWIGIPLEEFFKILIPRPHHRQMRWKFTKHIIPCAYNMTNKYVLSTLKYKEIYIWNGTITYVFLARK